MYNSFILQIQVTFCIPLTHTHNTNPAHFLWNAYSVESLFNGISIHNPMLEVLYVSCNLIPAELLPLVISKLPKLGNLATLKLALISSF